MPARPTGTEPLPVFVINLSRRPDRLADIAGQLERCGIAWSRIDAVDASTATPETLDAFTTATGPLGPLSPGDRGCTASHVLAWRALLETDAPAAVILEDDIEISADFASFCQAGAWIPADTRLLKLDKYSARPSKKLLGRARHPVGPNRSLQPLYMRHAGGAAYLITRACAQALQDQAGRISVPVDHLLFSPNVSATARAPGLYQLVPTAARQAVDTHGSDSAEQRAKRRKTLSQRLKRLYYEVNCLPRQILQMAQGARLKGVDYQHDP